MHLPHATRAAAAAAVLFLALSALSCRPAPTVKYQNAPEGADPEVAIVAVDTTGGLAPTPDERNTDGNIGVTPNSQIMIFGRGSHAAGIATLKLRLIHDNNVVNVATFKQSGAIGSQVTNPAMIYASDGIGNAGGTVPFSFKATDSLYWADIVATDAAGHTRKITVKFLQRFGSVSGGRPPPTGGTSGGGGTGSTMGNTMGNTSGTAQCQCPNLADPACGAADGQTCTIDAECRPLMKCLLDPQQPQRKSCQQQNLQCPKPTCYKPSDLTYDRDNCPSF